MFCCSLSKYSLYLALWEDCTEVKMFEVQKCNSDSHIKFDRNKLIRFLNLKKKKDVEHLSKTFKMLRHSCLYFV